MVDVVVRPIREVRLDILERDYSRRTLLKGREAPEGLEIAAGGIVIRRRTELPAHISRGSRGFALDPDVEQVGVRLQFLVERAVDSDLRMRRNALGILSEIGVPCRDWPRLRPLIDDPGHQVALLACEIGIKLGGAADRIR